MLEAKRFNPRPHAGGDFRPCYAAGRRRVSIRAPTRGATRSPHGRCPRPRRYHPRPHAGGDPSSWSCLDTVEVHPRPHAGGDVVTPLPTRSSVRFNRAPIAGGDSNRIGTRPRKASCFNPRPHAGGDSRYFCDGAAYASFNPRPHAGGDGFASVCSSLLSVFQSAPPRGGRPEWHGRCRTTCSGFNPCPHAGGEAR